jgi:hypothetical protein
LYDKRLCNYTVKREKDLIKKLRQQTPTILWDRIENLASVGKVNKVNFRPHQIAWHVRHPHSSFILLFSLKDKSQKLFRGSTIHELRTNGFATANCEARTWEQISLILDGV